MGAALVQEGQVGTTKFKNIAKVVEYPFNDSICGPKKTVKIFTRTTPVGDADYAGLPIGSECVGFVITSTAVSGVSCYRKTASGASGWNKVVHANEAAVPVVTTPKAATDADTTLTAVEVLGGIVTMTPTAARNVTLPTAALLVAAVEGVKVGSTIELLVVNNAAATHAITVVKGTGITDGSVAGLLAVAAANTARFIIRFTNVTASSEAAVIYRA
jgi:hypothetical protein